MQHPHVLVYSGDHADPAALVHDYVGVNLADVPQFVEELMRRYGDQVGAHSGLGTLDDVEGAGAVTLWPQDKRIEPIHIVLHSCEEPHDLRAAGMDLSGSSR